jgi:transposase
MPNTKPAYPPEFRQKMVDLVRSGRKFNELAKEFGVSHLSIRSWVQKANAVENPTSPEAIKMSEQEELKALRKENRILREERDILKKAAAWFAQETGTPSSKRSN